MPQFHTADSRSVSIIQSMASKKNSGTEVVVRTFAHNEDVVVPDGEELVSVDYDRTMAVTRVVSKRPYDSEANDKARQDAEDAKVATPTYPQPAGGVTVSPNATPPSTSFTWGSIDTTKVQNLEDLKTLPPTIAEQESAGKLSPEEAAKKDLPPDAAKDETEIATEIQAEANAESADAKNKPEDKS